MLIRELDLRTETAKLTNSFRAFVNAAWPIIVPATPLIEHFALDAICDHLQAVSAGQIKKLIINVPPGMAKSTLVATLWPVWEWTQHPEVQWLFATYANNLSYRDAARRRDIVKNPWYQERWGSKVQITQEGVEFLKNFVQGHMFSTSTGGQTLGWRGDRLVLDDPQDPKGAESDIKRESTIEWLTRTWPTRVNRGSKYAAEVLIQQRLHENDASGLYLKMGGWEHLKIPLQYKGKTFSTSRYSDPRTIHGQIISEAIYPPQATEELKRLLGPYGEAGQLDQEPAPLGGGIIKTHWLKPWVWSSQQPGHIAVDDGGAQKVEYHFDPWKCFRFITVDPAIGDKELVGGANKKKLLDPDYTVIACWCVFSSTRGPILVLLDLFRDRIEGPDIDTEITKMHNQWKSSVIAVETIAFQKRIFQELSRKSYPVREICTRNDDDVLYRIDQDKVARAVAATPLLADGRFFIPWNVPWAPDYINELTTFPNAAHDDCVDATSFGVAIALKIAKMGYSYYDALSHQKQNAQTTARKQDIPAHPLDGFYSSSPLE